MVALFQNKLGNADMICLSLVDLMECTKNDDHTKQQLYAEQFIYCAKRQLFRNANFRCHNNASTNIRIRFNE